MLYTCHVYEGASLKRTGISLFSRQEADIMKTCCRHFRWRKSLCYTLLKLRRLSHCANELTEMFDRFIEKQLYKTRPTQTRAKSPFLRRKGPWCDRCELSGELAETIFCAEVGINGSKGICSREIRECRPQSLEAYNTTSRSSIVRCEVAPWTIKSCNGCNSRHIKNVDKTTCSSESECLTVIVKREMPEEWPKFPRCLTIHFYTCLHYYNRWPLQTDKRIEKQTDAYLNTVSAAVGLNCGRVPDYGWYFFRCAAPRGQHLVLCPSSKPKTSQINWKKNSQFHSLG